jgi:hypothetical protein
LEKAFSLSRWPGDCWLTISSTRALRSLLTLAFAVPLAEILSRAFFERPG